MDRVRRRLADGVAISRVAASPGWAVAAFLLYLVMPLKRRIPSVASRPVSLKVRVGRDVHRISVSDFTEMLVLKEVLAQGEYDLPPGTPDPETILDLGANIGIASLRFRSLFPEALIVAVEPNPGTVEKLRRNVAGDPRITVVEAAVVADPGPVRLHLGTESWGASVGESGDGVEVPGVSVESLVRAQGWSRADLVKMDIEGQEHTVIPAIGNLGCIGSIIAEVHPNGSPDPSHDIAGSLAARAWGELQPRRRNVFHWGPVRPAPDGEPG